MGRLLLKACLALVIAAAVAYVGDFLVWKLRDLGGSGSASIKVTRYVVAPLKGGKEEYYPDGTDIVPCSRSLFPQPGGSACWWLARHPVVYDR